MFPILAHGGVDDGDAMLSLVIALVIFFVMMRVSWIRSRMLGVPGEDQDATTDTEPSADDIQPPDHIELD